MRSITTRLTVKFSLPRVSVKAAAIACGESLQLALVDLLQVGYKVRTVSAP